MRTDIGFVLRQARRPDDACSGKYVWLARACGQRVMKKTTGLREGRKEDVKRNNWEAEVGIADACKVEATHKREKMRKAGIGRDTHLVLAALTFAS